MKTLALDISTTCTGWSLWEDKKLIKAGAIESPTEEYSELPDKMDFVLSEIRNLSNIHSFVPDEIVAEAALKKMGGGKTTADTMSKLIAFNFCLCYNLSREFSAKLYQYDVRAARKKCGIIIPKIKSKNKSKEIKKIVIEHWKKQHVGLDWALKKTGSFKDWVGDMADSITIGEAHFKMT